MIRMSVNFTIVRCCGMSVDKINAMMKDIEYDDTSRGQDEHSVKSDSPIDS